MWFTYLLGEKTVKEDEVSEEKFTFVSIVTGKGEKKHIELTQNFICTIKILFKQSNFNW